MLDRSPSIWALIRSCLRISLVYIHSLSEFGSTRFLAGVIWCVFCGWVNSLSQIYVDRMHWSHFKEFESKPLPDIGFIILPRLNVSRLPDIWNAIIVLGTLLPVVLFHPSKVKIMRRFAAIQGTCFLLRSITIMATILPNPYDTCVNMSRDDEIPVWEALKVMLGMRITCGDVLYSGHAANFTLMALIWQEYGVGFASSPQAEKRGSVSNAFALDVSISPDAQIEIIRKYSQEWYTGVLLPRIFWIVAVLGYFIIIACRFHYTVDVVVGIVVVAKQWGLYHMIIRTPKLIERVPFLQWYESKGVYAPRPTEFEDDGSELGQFDTKSIASDQFQFYETPFVRDSPNAIKHELQEFALEEGKPLNREMSGLNNS
jgi:hypothetical protein